MRLPLPIALLALPRILALALVLATSQPVRAEGTEAIRHAIEDFLRRHEQTLPGRASHTIGTITAKGLPDCRSLDVTMDSSARPWGKTHVSVRCAEGASWSLYVPVQIHVAVDYLISARPIRAGQILTQADIETRPGDLFDLPSNILTDTNQAIGLISSTSLPAGRSLRSDMLRSPQTVTQGQNVKIISGGNGFQVSSEGRALNSAATGQVVQVRLASGQVISGIARNDGTVWIAY